jgi:hypothetical protein
MYAQDFISVFIEIYNAGIAFLMIFLIGQILFVMRRANRDVLKARLFFNESVIQHTWMYISIAGASFALNTIIKFVGRFTASGNVLSAYYIIELTQLIFLISFVLAIYNWYVFIGNFKNQIIKQNGT